MDINNWVFTIKVLEISVGEPLPVSTMTLLKVLQDSALPCLLAHKLHPHWVSPFSEQASSYLWIFAHVAAFLKYFPACFLGKSFFDLRNKAIITLNSLNISFTAFLIQLHIYISIWLILLYSIQKSPTWIVRHVCVNRLNLKPKTYLLELDSNLTKWASLN